MDDKLKSIALGVAGISFLLGVLAGNARWDNGELESTNYINCYEDEVIIWQNNSHSKCWPIDDMWMLEVID